jgi:peptidoglycan/xylan/chitin deacetylase (PgdA/CDA1 family)
VKPLLLTFDVEEFDLPVEWGRRVTLATQIDVTVGGLAKILPLLERHHVRATFFATGVFAQARGDLLRALADAGHEIAVHGLAHQDDYGRMEAAIAVDRLRAARTLIESTLGRSVHGVRTPHLRPCPAVRLGAAGFVYDASPHPTWVPTRYNGLGFPRRPWREDGLLRLPISVLPGLRLPISFVWYRAAGASLRRLGCATATWGAPYLHLYFHPWEAEAIRAYGAPAWLAVRCGEPFLAALDALLGWAALRLRAATLREFVDGYGTVQSPAAAAQLIVPGGSAGPGTSASAEDGRCDARAHAAPGGTSVERDRLCR